MSSLEHTAPAGAVAAAPSAWDFFADRAFRALAKAAAYLMLLLLAFILWQIGRKALPGIRDYGVVFLTQDFLPAQLAVVFRTTVELLAAIPSVVYGLWGIFFVVPVIRPAADWLYTHLGRIPFFGTTLSGPGLLPASLVLAIMILPTVAAVSQDALRQVPYRTKEAAYGMGATRWEAILKVMLSTALTGIFGALVLGFGRALGETMALAMLIGNSNQLSLSLFSPANTLAALLALNFPEAGPREVQVLMYAALVLLAITLLVNIAGGAMMAAASRQGPGK